MKGDPLGGKSESKGLFTQQYHNCLIFLMVYKHWYTI